MKRIKRSSIFDNEFKDDKAWPWPNSRKSMCAAPFEVSVPAVADEALIFKAPNYYFFQI